VNGRGPEGTAAAARPTRARTFDVAGQADARLVEVLRKLIAAGDRRLHGHPVARRELLAKDRSQGD
jgi:hypothetical protein